MRHTNFRWRFRLCLFPNRTDTSRCIAALHPPNLSDTFFSDRVSNTMLGLLMTSPTSFLGCIVRWTVPLGLVAGFPSLRLLMGTLLPYRIFRSHNFIARRHFRLGNPRLVYWERGAFYVVGWDFRHLLHLVVGSFWLSRSHTCKSYDRQNASVSIFISPLSAIAPTSDCPSGSLAFILVHKFSSWHSVVRWKFPQLMPLRTCCFSLKVSPLG